MNPAQISAEVPTPEKRIQALRTLAMKKFLEAKQSDDLRKDIASHLSLSDGPFFPGDKSYYWTEDKSKIKSDGSHSGKWIKGKVVSSDGSMVGIDLGTRIVKVNVSKITQSHRRCGHSSRSSWSHDLNWYRNPLLFFLWPRLVGCRCPKFKSFGPSVPTPFRRRRRPSSSRPPRPTWQRCSASLLEKNGPWPTVFAVLGPVQRWWTINRNMLVSYKHGKYNDLF